ncbi:uncharacterized protein [Rutidosis leptorrhynchoides]|uniref:uncharacterized protein n=1 Tax=Rutidosis leptorrhynchoides TaxID=125765 RepID=UPI003A99638A
MGISFKKSFIKQIGNGLETSFWNEIWIGNTKLKEVYPRLFRLEVQKDAPVGLRLQGNGLFNWAWARQPLGRGLDELESLEAQLAEVSIGPENEKWSWNLDGENRFTVKFLSGICDDYILQLESNPTSTLRNNLVPKKIEIFVWRLMKKRLPVRIELDKRGIDLHSVRCPICDDDLETTDHIILHCPYAHDVWSRIF